MTLIDMPLDPRRDAPPRAGQPWTDEHLCELVALTAAGHDFNQLTVEAGRSRQAVLTKLRRMLPVDERGCPEPLLLPRLRELLGQGHDWRHTMLKDNPPRPVHQPPAVHRAGVAGLADDDLVEVADAIIRTNLRQADLVERVRQEVVDRRLGDRLVARRVRDLVRSTPTYHHEEEFRMAAEQWVSNGLDGPVGPVGPHAWRAYDEPWLR